MGKKTLVYFGVAFIILAVVATAAVLFLYPYIPTQPPKANNTGCTQQGVQEVVDANNQFAFDLYSELSKSENGNIFYSPYNISSALAMTYEGAKGQTAQEMQEVLHIPKSDTIRRTEFNRHVAK